MLLDQARELSESSLISHAAAVKKTNDSCTVSKWSVADSGYYQDGVLRSFVHQNAKRRASLINRCHSRRFALWMLPNFVFDRCYCVRYVCLDRMVTKFLEFSAASFEGSTIQVVILGAGFDSSFWRLKAKFPKLKLRFVEIDFPDVCRRKCTLARMGGHFANERILADTANSFRMLQHTLITPWPMLPFFRNGISPWWKRSIYLCWLWHDRQQVV